MELKRLRSAPELQPVLLICSIVSTRRNVVVRRPMVCNRSKRMKEKRVVLDGIAAELRRIIGRPAVEAADQDEQRFAVIRKIEKPFWISSVLEISGP